MKGILVDIICVVSMTAVVYGLSMISLPAAFIGGGILGICAAVVIALGG